MQLHIPDSVVPAELKRSGNHEEFSPSLRDEEYSSGAQITSMLAENQELKGQLELLRGEKTRWVDMQRRMMELLHSPAPEKLVHDLRNLLNERDLLKTLVDQI